MQQNSRYKPLTVLMAFAFCGLFFGAVHAATITVDSDLDGSDTTSCTLRDAVKAVNTQATVNACEAGNGSDDTIVFDASLAGATILVTSGGQIEIEKDLIIDAMDNSGSDPVSLGITLDAGGNNRIFYVSDGDVLTVRGLTFKNGDSTDSAGDKNGGAILVGNISGFHLNIEGCGFQDNKAGSYGGAIRSGGSDVMVDASTFSGNETTSAGGAIYAENVEVSNSTFRENTAISGNSGDNLGGAIYGVRVMVSDSTFTGNSSSDGVGGAIYGNDEVTASNSTFTGNLGGKGGAIRTYGIATVLENTFENNTADYEGGAIYADGGATVSNSTFSGNQASRGGALYVEKDIMASASTFIGNEANNNGGAIWVGGNLSANHLTLVNNTATDDGASVYKRYGGDITIHNSIIVGAQSKAHCMADAGYSPTITGTHNLEWTSDNGGSDGASCSDQTDPKSISAGGINGAGVAISAIISTTLEDNGGATQTLKLPVNSPALDQADDAGTGNTSQMLNIDFSATPPTATWEDAVVDQRGRPRKPATEPRDLGAHEDNGMGFRATIPLPEGVEGATYTSTPVGTVSFCLAACTFSANGLPDGMDIDSDGNLFGTPTESGTFIFEVTIVDGGRIGASSTHPMTLIVRPLGGGAGATSVPVLPLPLLLVLAGLLAGIGGTVGQRLTKKE